MAITPDQFVGVVDRNSTVLTAGQALSAASWPVVIASDQTVPVSGTLNVTPQPAAGTDLTSSSGAVAATTATATLAGAANKTTYITGFTVTGGGATAASIVTMTVTGTISGTLTYLIPVPAGATAGIQPLNVQFTRPVPASGQNVSIVASAPSFGAGNTNACVTATGFRL